MRVDDLLRSKGDPEEIGRMLSKTFLRRGWAIERLKQLTTLLLSDAQVDKVVMGCFEEIKEPTTDLHHLLVEATKMRDASRPQFDADCSEKAKSLLSSVDWTENEKGLLLHFIESLAEPVDRSPSKSARDLKFNAMVKTNFPGHSKEVRLENFDGIMQELLEEEAGSELGRYECLLGILEEFSSDDGNDYFVEMLRTAIKNRVSVDTLDVLVSRLAKSLTDEAAVLEEAMSYCASEGAAAVAVKFGILSGFRDLSEKAVILSSELDVAGVSYVAPIVSEAGALAIFEKSPIYGDLFGMCMEIGAAAGSSNNADGDSVGSRFRRQFEARVPRSLRTLASIVTRPQKPL